MNTTANPASQGSHTFRQPTPDNQAPQADQRMRQAVARIQASRSALIVCLAPDPPKRRGNTTDGDDESSGSSSGASNRAQLSFVETLKARIKRNGLLQGSWRTVRALARRWWTRQSWHSSVDLVVETLAHEARPLMRRHPLATLAVGAALGAGLVALGSAARPWAWHQIRGNGSPWNSRVGKLLWTQFTSAPVQMAVAGALAAWVADQGIRRKTRSDGPAGRTTPHGDPAANAAPSDEMPRPA